jgi:hypothetical protein
LGAAIKLLSCGGFRFPGGAPARRFCKCKGRIATKADFSALRHRKAEISVGHAEFCVNFMRFPLGKPDILALVVLQAPYFLALPPPRGIKKAAHLGGFYAFSGVIQRLNQPFTFGPVIGAI